MELNSEIVNYTLTILTLFVGAYGTFFNFKDKSRITKHGWTALILLIVLASLSVYSQSINNINERKESKKLRDEAIEARKLLEDSQTKLLKITEDLKNQADQQSDFWGNQQKSQIKFWNGNQERINSIVSQNEESILKLTKLLNPLEKISFSFSLEFDNFKGRYPKYSNLIDSIFLFLTKGGWSSFDVSHISVDEYDSYQNLFIEPESIYYPFSNRNLDKNSIFTKPSEMLAIFYQVENKTDFRKSLSSRTEDLIFYIGLHENFKSSGTESRIKSTTKIPLEEIEYFPRENKIVYHVEYLKTNLIKDSGWHTSIIDIINPSENSNQYLEFRMFLNFHGSVPKLSDFKIHFGESGQHTTTLDPKKFKFFILTQFETSHYISYYFDLSELRID